MHSARRGQIALTLFILGAVGVALLSPLRGPVGWTGWYPLVWNWAHAPVMGIVAWVLWPFVRRRTPSLGGSLVITWGVVTLLAALVEGLQALTGRSPEWGDVICGSWGAAAIVAVRGAWHHRGRPAIAWATLALISALASAHPILLRAWATRENDTSFPRLASFKHTRELALWRLEQNGDPQRLCLDPAGLVLDIPAHGLLSLQHDARSRDWSQGASLAFHYEFAGTTPLRLGIRIDSPGLPRLRREVYLNPGTHSAAVALARPEEELKQLQKVEVLTLFTLNPGQHGQLSLSDLELVPASH